MTRFILVVIALAIAVAIIAMAPVVINDFEQPTFEPAERIR